MIIFLCILTYLLGVVAAALVGKMVNRFLDGGIPFSFILLSWVLVAACLVCSIGFIFAYIFSRQLQKLKDWYERK